MRALLTQRSAPQGGHPQVLDRGRALVANLRFRELLAIFVAAFLGLAALAGIGLELTEPGGAGARSLAHWVHEAALGLAGSPSGDLSAETADDARHAMQLLIAFTSILLPGIALGAIVFRLFVRDRTLVFRSEPALVHCDRGPGQGKEWRLILRLYPATYLLLLDLAFTIFVQQDRVDPDGGLVLSNTPMPVLNDRWPVGDTHSPYSLSIPLNDDDVKRAPDGALTLHSIRGQEVDEDTQLIVHVVGHIPELGSEFSEHHRVELPFPLREGGYFGVTVHYDGRGPAWEGWDKFERVRTPTATPGTPADD